MLSRLQPVTARVALASSALLRRSSSSNTKDYIGVIGLGQMGGHMANNLFAKGQKLVVCDVDPLNTQSLAKKGVHAAKTPREVADMCDTVLTMLPNTAIVEKVFFGKDGVYDGIRREQLFIDSSTIDPHFTKQLSKRVHDKHALIVDAPVSGGVGGAEKGTLTFMVGGNDQEFNAVKPVLALMGKNIVHCGPSSTGQVAKVCNNLALAIQMASVAEAMNLGVTLGMDPKVLMNIMNTSTSQCWSSTVYQPYPGLLEGVPSYNNYKGGFASKLMKKDLGLGVDAAKQAEVTLPLTFAVHQLYSLIVNQGDGNKDFSYILPFLKGKMSS